MFFLRQYLLAGKVIAIAIMGPFLIFIYLHAALFDYLYSIVSQVMSLIRLLYFSGTLNNCSLIL